MWEQSSRNNSAILTLWTLFTAPDVTKSQTTQEGIIALEFLTIGCGCEGMKSYSFLVTYFIFYTGERCGGAGRVMKLYDAEDIVERYVSW